MAAVAPTIVATSVQEGRPPTSPAVSDKTVVAAQTDSEMPSPGQRRALFSTVLGSRPPRAVQSPPFPPTIVRSVKVTGIVDAAQLWQQKFPRQVRSIFPGCGWTIEDFWDDKDIQMDGAEHYRDVLQFLMADNVWCARKFAKEWSTANPEQLASTIGLADLSGLYDTANPEAIVDKIFVGGEIHRWSRQFLWHAAHMMRGTMVAMEAERKFARGDNTKNSTKSTADQKPSVSGEGLAVDGSTKVKTSKPSPAMQSAPISAMPPQVPPPQPLVAPPLRRAPSYGPPQPAFHTGQPIGHAMSHMPSPAMNIPAPLHISKGGRTGYGPPPPGMRPASYGEQFPRVSSGTYSAHPSSGSMSNTHSPHMNPASMAMGQPMMGPPFGQHPFQPALPPMSPSAYSAQPYHPAMGPPGLAPHMMQMQSPNMQPGYMQQGPSDRGPRGMPFGDMTNHPPHQNHMPPNMGMHQRDNRRNSSYSNGPGSLFDPYNGTKPAFNDTNAGRKASRSSYTNNHDRSRKSSGADQRPRTSSYGYDRAENGYGDYRPYNKGRTVDDPEIVNDKVYGCGENWIGSKNTTVKDLFISDLSDHHHQQDVTDMFQRMVGITPSNILIKTIGTSNRRHAFVTFDSTSDAKKALVVHDRNPRARNNPVRVTVPRRHFQKSAEYVDSHEPSRSDRQASHARNAQGAAPLSSPAEGSNFAVPEDQGTKSQYSPQDVRSDPLASISCRSSDASGSPNAWRSKTRKTSPTENPKLSPQESIEEEAVEVEVPTSAAIAETSKDVAQDIVMASVAETADQPPKPAAEAAKPVSSDKVDTPTEQSSEQIIPAVKTESIVDKRSPSSPTPATAPTPVQTDLQTKEVLKEAEIAGPIVKIPTAPQAQEAFGNTEVPKTIVDIPTKSQRAVEAAKIGHEKATDPQEQSTDSEVKSSEEQAGPDTSAVAAQKNTVVSDPSIGSVVEPVPVDHGTQPSASSLAEQSDLEDSATAADEILPVPPPTGASATKTSEPAAAITTAESTDAAKVDTMDDLTKQGAAKEVAEPAENPAAKTDNTEVMTTASPESSADALRRNGPQQTTSLNPFAKKTKAQREKEKERLKKEKKKSAEKAAKAKVEKSASPTTSQKPAALNDEAPDSTTNAVASTKLDMPAQSVQEPPHTAEDMAKALEDAKRKGKGKDKDKASVAVSSPTATVESNGDVSGKQIGGTTTTTTLPDKAGSVTEKAEVAQETTKASSTKDQPAPPTPVQSLERVAASQTQAVRILGSSELARETGDGAVYKKKKAPTELSKLDTSSSGDQTMPLSATNDPTTTDTFSSRRESIAVSVASSTTLNASEAALGSPSPTTENFYTPLQTPGAPPTASQEQAPKSKKKKPKKKKKPAATQEATETPFTPSASASTTNLANRMTTPGSSSDEDLVFSHDPFGNQMSHIDAIRNAVKDPNTYYSSVNREMAEKAQREKDAKEALALRMSQIQGFMVENEHQLAKANAGR